MYVCIMYVSMYVLHKYDLCMYVCICMYVWYDVCMHEHINKFACKFVCIYACMLCIHIRFNVKSYSTSGIYCLHNYVCMRIQKVIQNTVDK